VTTTEAILAYLSTQPILCSFFSATLSVEEIGDGNLNFVFRLQDDHGASLIIKHAPAYLRMLGEDFALPQERIHAEMRTLSYFSTITPHYVPTLYACDEEAFCIAMEDLREHVLLQGQKEVSQNVYAKLGDFLGCLYLNTPPSKEPSVYENATLKKISEAYIFRFPHIPNHPALSPVPYFAPMKKSSLFQNNIDTLLERFLGAKEHLLHGDLHTGSVLILGEDVKIIDAEFAFFGPLGFDLGTLMAHLLFEEIHSLFTHRTLHYRERLSALFEGFSQRVGTLPLSVLQESIGFCGAELFRRLVVPAKAKPLEALENETLKQEAYALCEKLSIETVECFLHVSTLEAFLALLDTHLCPKTL
jgi:5-methylthioribose kinase